MYLLTIYPVSILFKSFTGFQAPFMSGLRLGARGGGFGEITRSSPQQADILPDMTYNLLYFVYFIKI